MLKGKRGPRPESSHDEKAAQEFADQVKKPRAQREQEAKDAKAKAAASKPTAPDLIQAELCAIGHILHKDNGRMLAIGVKFPLDRDLAHRMHKNARDAFDLVTAESSVKRVVIDSQEWSPLSVKFYDTPDSPAGMQLQDAIVRNVRVFRVEKENESRRMIQFDVTVPVAAAGPWPQAHYRADVWITFAKSQGSLFEEAA